MSMQLLVLEIQMRLNTLISFLFSWRCQIDDCVFDNFINTHHFVEWPFCGQLKRWNWMVSLAAHDRMRFFFDEIVIWEWFLSSINSLWSRSELFSKVPRFIRPRVIGLTFWMTMEIVRLFEVQLMTFTSSEMDRYLVSIFEIGPVSIFWDVLSFKLREKSLDKRKTALEIFRSQNWR
jgi:hypothetical protein